MHLIARHFLGLRIIVLGALCCTMLAHIEIAEARPRVGLVLGGGGARGAAHIGVLEVLEQQRVPVDCLAGTSMGALVAGAYAAGLTPAMMRAALEKADWHDMFQDNPDYSELSYRNKRLAQRFLPGSETGVTEDGLQYPAGAVSGQKIKLFFNQLVRADLGERHIESLRLPLSIITTDIETGEKLVLREGSLTQAMRASMSVPGVMSPVEYRGRKLVDGGLVDNLPIRELRERCGADIIIAVNVGTPLLKADQLSSLLAISVQMVSILTEQNVSQSLASLKAQDIYIQPNLEGISAADFDRHADTALRGRQAAEKIQAQLKNLALNAADYRVWQQNIVPTQQASPRVDAIEIAGLQRVNPQAVTRHISQRVGEPLDTQKLNRDALRVYGDGHYESVDYSLLDSRERNLLRITPIEKRWGPDYARLGLNLTATSSQGSSYNLRGAYHKTWLNSLGGELIASAQVGQQRSLALELYQPLDAQQRFFVEPELSVKRENRKIYQKEAALAEYQVTESTAAVSVGANIGLLGQVRASWREVWRDASLETGTAWISDDSKRIAGASLSLDLDQMNRLYFPTRGWGARFNYFDSAIEDYSKLYLELRGSYPISAAGDLILSGRASYTGSTHGQLPRYDVATAGGIFNLTAFAPGQLAGDGIRFGQIRAEKIMGRLPLGLRGDMRVGLALEAAKVNNPLVENTWQGWLDSTSLYVGGETPFGPVYLGYGWSSKGVSGAYLFFGTP